MPRLSEGLIFHVRQHEILCKYIIWTYSGIEEAELWQSRQSRSAFTSLGMKADLKCETTDFLQSRQKGSAEAELPIFGNEGKVLMEKPIFRSLAVKIEQKCRSETANLWKSRQRWNADEELHIFGSPGRTSAETELQICASQVRAEVREQNFAYLAVKAEPISYWLSLPMLKNNSTDCYIEGQWEYHVWLKHMTFAMRVTRSIGSCKGSG